MKQDRNNNDWAARRASARRTALIVGGIAILLFALSIVGTLWQKK